jgi:hypothetical protein
MISGRVAISAFVFLSLVLPWHLSYAQKNSPVMADRELQRHSLAVNLVRAINTAESHYKKTHGVYAAWDTLVANGDFTDTGTKWAPETLPTVAHATYNRGAEIVPGWKLRLSLSKEGTAYDLLLEDVTDPKCAFAVFSDERGLIRQGQSVDCQP